MKQINFVSQSLCDTLRQQSADREEVHKAAPNSTITQFLSSFSDSANQCFILFLFSLLFSLKAVFKLLEQQQNSQYCMLYILQKVAKSANVIKKVDQVKVMIHSSGLCLLERDSRLFTICYTHTVYIAQVCFCLIDRHLFLSKTEDGMTVHHHCFQDLKSFLLQGLFPKRLSTSDRMDSDSFGRTCGMRREKGLL